MHVNPKVSFLCSAWLVDANPSEPIVLTFHWVPYVPYSTCSMKIFGTLLFVLAAGYRAVTFRQLYYTHPKGLVALAAKKPRRSIKYIVKGVSRLGALLALIDVEGFTPF